MVSRCLEIVPVSRYLNLKLKFLGDPVCTCTLQASYEKINIFIQDVHNTYSNFSIKVLFFVAQRLLEACKQISRSIASHHQL